MLNPDAPPPDDDDDNSFTSHIVNAQPNACGPEILP